MSDDPNDYTALFNTELPPADEAKFQAWQKVNPRLGNTYDYDARGFWKSGAATAGNGHGSDAWKKPNHPTFSSESKYNGMEGMTGGQWLKGPQGKWMFFASPTNLQHHSQQELNAYFKQVEPDNQVVYPAPGAWNFGR